MNIRFDMDIKFDFELAGLEISEFNKEEVIALNKLKDFIKQRFSVLKDEIDKYPAGFTVFYAVSDEVDEPMKIFGYPQFLADRMRQSFGQSELDYILSQIAKILTP